MSELDQNIVQNLFDSVVAKDYDTFFHIVVSYPDIFNTFYVFRYKDQRYSPITNFIGYNVGLIPYQFIAKMIEIDVIKNDDYYIIERSFNIHRFEYISNRYGDFDMTAEEYQENFFRTTEMLIDHFGVENLNSHKFGIANRLDGDTRQCNMMERFIDALFVSYGEDSFYQNMIIMMLKKGISLPQIFDDSASSEDYASNSSLHYIYKGGFVQVIEYLIEHHPESIASIPKELKEKGVSEFKGDIDYWKKNKDGDQTLFEKYHPESEDTLTKLISLID